MRIKDMLKRTKNLISKYKLAIRNFKKKVEKLEQEKMDMYEITVSTIADFDNYKKRASRHQIEFKRFANQKLLQDILTVVDSIKEIPIYSNDGIAIDGVEMILKEITKIFKKFNVEPIEAVGKQFEYYTI
jgi:molecular chaperone GrpE